MVKILNLYLAKKFIKIFLSFAVGLIFIIFISNFLNNLKSSVGDNISNLSILIAAAYDVPFFFQLALPFVILVTTLFFIRNISNTNELDIIKASGMPIWQLTKIVFPIVMVIGCLVIFIISPISSILKSKNVANSSNSTITTTENSFWIIDKHKNIKIIIKAKKAVIKNNIIHFSHIIVFKIVNGTFSLRVDGTKAIIQSGKIIITNANVKDNTTMFPRQLSSFTLNTALSAKNLQNVVLEPNMIEIWNIPSFIKNLENLGLNTAKYKVYFYNLLAYPIILFAMFILGIGLALSREKRISSTKIIITGIISGFSLHFFIDIINTFGSSGLIPPLVTIIGELSLILSLGTFLIVNKEGL